MDLVFAKWLRMCREAAIDASHAIYDEVPLSTPDEWGDLEAWCEAAGRT